MTIENLVKMLINLNKTVATMESCTGGFIANSITNVSGASDIFKFGAVTYSNEYKIKMGVSKEIIDEYSVYSEETAKEMSYRIAEFTNSDYGIGVTGKINRADKNNEFGSDSVIFASIYDKNKNEYWLKKIDAIAGSRLDNKKMILDNIIQLFIWILGNTYGYLDINDFSDTSYETMENKKSILLHKSNK